VFSVDTANGALRSVGSPKVGVHDAAGSVVGGRDVVFGGVDTGHEETCAVLA
jgi:hypothetical protein